MAQYISKSQTVEARQYEADLPLTVVHDSMGEMIAHKGDWLVGGARGQVYVLSADKFAAKFEPYTATPDADALKAAQAQVAALTGEIAAAKATSDALTAQVAQLTADKAALASQAGDTAALTAQVANLNAKLAAAQAQADSDEKKLADLAAAAHAAKDAQTAIDAAQAKIDQQLG